ncbi:hypothetical protein [Geodermatophilus maliterrae]|uniref:Prevent-host-death family protein n=1 Tax=Geodermatophilus maliterrae TaxID=3162531 RepID=A0ABV3XFX8_9ACTN
MQITVDGEPVAELGPIHEQRSRWTPMEVLAARLTRTQADPAPREELRAPTGDTDELGPIC